MKLGIEWKRPLPLRKDRMGTLLYTVDLSKLAPDPGIYVFARKWGTTLEALYVGQSNNLRGRVKGHLNNLRLMKHIQDSKDGKRILLTGRVITKPGQRLSKCLDIVERALILHFLSEGHDLVNKQGIKIKRHEIECDGPVPRRFMPSTLYLRN